MLRHKIRTDLKRFNENGKNEYPAPEEILQNIDDCIPEVLSIFMEDLLEKDRKGLLDDVKRKTSVIKHAIPSTIRPKSFLSPLQLAISVYLHRTFGSKNLCKCISSLGVSASYDETALYEKCIVLGPRCTIKKGSFSQFMFDKTDFNINIIDGKHTLHSMGCLQSVYPENCFEKIEMIPRLKEKPKAENLANVDKIQFYIYENVNPTKFEKLIAEKLSVEDVNNRNMNNTELL